MASLTKTGLSDGNTLTAVMITDLYDAWMGNKSYDNIAINNSTLRVRHDGKISIGTAATDHAVNVEGTVSASAFIGGSITLTTGGTYHWVLLLQVLLDDYYKIVGKVENQLVLRGLQVQVILIKIKPLHWNWMMMEIYNLSIVHLQVVNF